MKIEFCIESAVAAKAAQKHGAHRIELCSSLNKDGLTPTIELIKNCKAVYKGEIHIMIRPKEGDFHYNQNEIIQMKTEIKLAHQFNLKGVVFGLLLKNGDIDTNNTKTLHEYAKEFNLELIYVEINSFQGGSIVRVAQFINGPYGIDGSVTRLIEYEKLNKFNKLEKITSFSTKLNKINDIAIKDSHMIFKLKDFPSAETVIKLSIGKKKHVLTRKKPSSSF